MWTVNETNMNGKRNKCERLTKQIWTVNKTNMNG